MNIRFSEIEDDQNNNPYNYYQNSNTFNIQEQNKVITPNFYQPYYENKNAQSNINANKPLYNSSGENMKKEKMTFDDILSNMNMKVIDGSLKLTPDINNNNEVNKKKSTRFEPFNFNSDNALNNHQHLNNHEHLNNHQHLNNHEHLNNNTENIKKVKFQEPSSLAPEVKNSWIYNKYFKDYKEQGMIEEPEIPLTPEELKQKLIIDYIERIKARQRIAQIKPKKMMFSNNNVMIPGIYASQNNPQLNNLFRFK